MKKLTAVAVMVFGIMSLNAQDDTPAVDMQSKRGVAILPQAGDYGLGVNAAPFLNYIGNTFNNSTGNSTSFDFMSSEQMIFGKYFLSDQVALRGSLRFASNSFADKNYVNSDASTSPEVFVKDSRTTRSHFYGISGGIEYRRGEGRLQGYYGGEMMLGWARNSTHFNYGNEMTSTNPTPTTTTDFASGAAAANGNRLLTETSGNMYMVHARGFVGVEYFFAPRISIGGEFGWGPGFEFGNDGSATTETINAENQLNEITRDVAQGRGFMLDTDNLAGAIRLMFHF